MYVHLNLRRVMTPEKSKTAGVADIQPGRSVYSFFASIALLAAQFPMSATPALSGNLPEQDDQTIKTAIEYVLSRRMDAIWMDDRSNGGSKLYQIVPIAGVEEFLQINPNCCTTSLRIGEGSRPSKRESERVRFSHFVTVKDNLQISDPDAPLEVIKFETGIPFNGEGEIIYDMQLEQ